MSEKIVLETGLVVTNIRPRADSTGSWPEEYSDATVNREPTKAEFKILQEEHKIIGVDFCQYSKGEAPDGMGRITVWPFRCRLLLTSEPCCF